MAASLCLRASCMVVILGVVSAKTISTLESGEKGAQPAYGTPFDDVIVESTLTVRKKVEGAEGRQSRKKKVDAVAGPGEKLIRAKRQRPNRFPGFRPQFGFNNNGFGGTDSNANSNSQSFETPFGGSSQSAANAASHGFQFNPNGFGGGSSAAQAQAQGFESHGPLGQFGASAANAASQGLNFGPNGLTGNAGLSGSQAYLLPNGQTVDIAYSNGFAFGPDGRPTVTRGNSITFGKPNAGR